MAPNEPSSLSVLIERTRVKLKAELCTTLRVEAIVDPDFERASEVDDLVREVKEAKEWLGSVGFLVSPEFLDAGMNVVSEPIALRGPLKEPEVVGGATNEPEPRGTVCGSLKAWKECPRSPSPEMVAVEPTPAQCRKGRANALVSESDKVPQSVAKHGYPEHAYLLGWLIYNGHEVLKRPAKLARQGRCVGDAFVIARAVSRQRPEVKERGSKGMSKGKAKDKGSTTDTSEGTRMSTLVGEERMEELVERSEELMRSVSRKLNDLSGEVLELEGVQAMIRKLTK
ncbi:hypothetical protein JB92DRAFT_3226816 [Gautieria morchelliformis]|nr:hypothetical protein JB92DRAFT_3226816 [Gautieria morchelliformis]